MYAQLYFMFFYRHGDHRDLHVLTHSFPTRRSSDLLKPAEMHRTQLAATAIDRVAPNRDAVVGEVAAYGGADLLCYRAETPPSLAERQHAAWQPHLDWRSESTRLNSSH